MVNGVLRLVSWNLAYGKPGRFKTVANRRRQWALLGALAPDIALLQECRSSDLKLHAPGWMADDTDVWEYSSGVGACVLRCWCATRFASSRSISRLLGRRSDVGLGTCRAAWPQGP